MQVQNWNNAGHKTAVHYRICNLQCITETERKRFDEMQNTFSSTLQETQRLEELLEAQRNELESMRTQTALTETKHTASIRKMEAEHKIDVERQVWTSGGRVLVNAQFAWRVCEEVLLTDVLLVKSVRPLVSCFSLVCFNDNRVVLP